ncbi:DUF2304 domain-containing protein [Chitinimonas lacunae]|uniref:DUF2304 domain-containing protein n=1 Tax=Chitinimonas lacunae TaxID=1963018 RepID=A0ABV8MWU6_9NEIS
MNSLILTSTAIGVTLCAVIVFLVRRDHLQIRRALFWLLIAAGALLFGLFPQLSDWLAQRTGVAYPPMLVAVAALAIFAVKLLLVDMSNTRMEHDLRRLNQRLALYEAMLESTGRSVTDSAVERS